MAINKREKNLAVVAGVLVVPFLIWLVVGTLGGSTGKLKAENESLRGSIDEADKTIHKGQEAQKQLDEWSRRCLPSDVEAAGSRYKFWLMELCESDRYDAKFKNTQVKPVKNKQPMGDVGYQLGFSVSGEASLEQLTRWLYGFYSSDYLHQIKSLSITPLEESKKLTVNIQVEALVLNNAVDSEGKPRTEALAALSEDAADQDALDKYCDTIGNRAIFTRYTPPPPERPAAPPQVAAPSRPLFDHGKFTRVTGFTEVNGKPAVWIRMMTTGKDLQLFEGETFEVGPLQAKILDIEIDDRTVTSEVDGKQYLIALGDNLRDAKEIGGNEEAAPK